MNLKINIKSWEARSADDLAAPQSAKQVERTGSSEVAHANWKDDPQKELLDSLLFYNSETGKFYWKVFVGNRIKPGTEAGSIMRKLGYIRISINGKSRSAHRLAWIMFHGLIPRGFQVDHKNRVRHDNRISNLRLAKHHQNGYNRKVSSKSTTGYSGVNFCKRTRKWKASLRCIGYKTHLGYFDKKEDAISARQKAEIVRFNEFKPETPFED